MASFCKKSCCNSSRSSSCRSYSDTPDKRLRCIRAHCNQPTKCYRLTAELLPDNCFCPTGTDFPLCTNTGTASCSASIGNVTISQVRMGSGRGDFKLKVDCNSHTALLSWNIQWKGLSPNGGSGSGQSSQTLGVFIKGPVKECFFPSGVFINASAIWQTATGMPLDCGVTGSWTISEDDAKNFLKGYFSVVIVTQNFSSSCNGEIAGKIKPVKFNKCCSSSSSSGCSTSSSSKQCS